jgi:hypothetical protein
LEYSTAVRALARMPIEAHAEVGRLLKSVLTAAHHRKGVYNRVNAVRSELDEWTQREYGRAELPSEQFSELYYHESGSTFERALSETERARHDMSLVEAKKILTQYYPDCPPLRSLLKTRCGSKVATDLGLRGNRKCLAQNVINSSRQPPRPFVLRPSWKAGSWRRCPPHFRTFRATSWPNSGASQCGSVTKRVSSTALPNGRRAGAPM